MSTETRVITGAKTRFAYLNVKRPRIDEGGKLKYGACLLIPKDDEETLDKISDAVWTAYETAKELFAGTDGKVPTLEEIKVPIKDGDIEKPDDPDYAGHYFINAGSIYKPEVVNAQLEAVPDDEIYSGMVGRASVTFFAYAMYDNKGIGCALNNIQKLYEGRRMDRRRTAAEDFAEYSGTDNKDGGK
ncbi:MAG: DUF2815 family protein [Oribacterium sp.]|nr:DUF2815 family protein [Oribacterium sp.]